MTKEQFENKYVGKAVHCDTEEKAKEFLALALKYGWSVFRNEEIIEITRWNTYKENTCYRIEYDKKMGYCNLDFYKLRDWEIVEFESEENKMRKTKKVFDLGLYVDWSIKGGTSQEKILDYISIWALKSHGKTAEEMRKNGKLTIGEWLKEVEVEFELSEKEIEVLKALKVLGFSWIGRDENGELYAYDSKPIKNTFSYVLDGWLHLDKDLFSFISWEDEEATNVDELLKNA